MPPTDDDSEFSQTRLGEFLKAELENATEYRFVGFVSVAGPVSQNWSRLFLFCLYFVFRLAFGSKWWNLPGMLMDLYSVLQIDSQQLARDHTELEFLSQELQSLVCAHPYNHECVASYSPLFC